MEYSRSYDGYEVLRVESFKPSRDHGALHLLEVQFCSVHLRGDIVDGSGTQILKETLDEYLHLVVQT